MNLREFIIEKNGLIKDALEDYKKWFEGDEECLKDINNCLEELKYALDDANSYYPITHISKEDLLWNSVEEFEKQIKELNEEDMKRIADLMNDSFNNCDDYSQACQYALEVVLKEKNDN